MNEIKKEKKPKQLTEEEFYILIHKIAKPTFNFMLKRIKNEILKNEVHKSLDLNQFFNVIVASMGSIDTNLIRWMQNFHKIKTNSEIDSVSIFMSFIKYLQEQLKTVVQ